VRCCLSARGGGRIVQSAAKIGIAEWPDQRLTAMAANVLQFCTNGNVRFATTARKNRRRTRYTGGYTPTRAR